MPNSYNKYPRAYMTTAIIVKTVALFLVQIILLGIFGVTLFRSANASIIITIILFLSLLIATIHETRKHARLDALLFRIEKLPIVSSAKAHFNYPIQLYGKIIANESLLTSPYTKNKCVYYHYIKEKEIKSENGSHWKVIKNTIKYIDFSISDSQGNIKVDPRNIDKILGSIYSPTKTNREIKNFPFSEIECTRGAYHSRRITSSKLFGFIPYSTGANVRHTEYHLLEGTNVFLSGFVHKEKGEEVIAESESYPLIITKKSKSEYLNSFGDGSEIYSYSNIILVIGLLFGFFVLSFFRAVTFEIYMLPTFIVALAIITIRWIIGTHNRLVMLEERCNNSEKNIDIQLKLRNNLIPKLVNVVKASSKFEKKVLEEITNTRIEIEKNLTKEKLKDFYKADLKLRAILFRKEAYPTLSSSKNFNRLMKDLEEIENNISDSRKFYNKTATKYNIALNKFPNSVFKNFKHLNEKDLWKL
ncbi:MAG: hypothetical protein HON47_01255 [Candidatus Diapherotrites archaeon]|jgi:LemA protein|uniref:RING-type E3 ubiquitin transferase n=1 Tax=Candidatus Iainarchaeum sp. TaxID=3101447 RepID=A0A8T5GE46_9ARCH|nr:hypothetical protein [Candidatus Diapherotrites archaeon]MBT7241416.1 hypothetical protein [Candidatus Diapherotrites archaeon]